MREDLTTLLSRRYGEGDMQRILTGYGSVRPVTLRFNSLKIAPEEGKRRLKEEGFSFESVPWYDAAVILSGEKDIAATSLYENGEIYLQSLSSMLPPLYLGAAAGETVLDMAAAPGGKTTEICALSEGKALVTACERDKRRFERLKFNLSRQSASRVTPMQIDAGALDPFFSFDKVLLDAPCSGSGTVQDLEEARIDSAYVQMCSLRQFRLLRKGISLLKCGGELVYSTCSILPEENEEILFRVAEEMRAVVVPIEAPQGVPLLPSPEGTVCVCPTSLYEGFFVAKIRRK